MLFRTLTPEDAAAFQALRLRGLAEAPTAFASSYEEEVNTPIAEIERRLQPKASGALFGAFAAGALAGIAGIERESMAKLSHKAYLWGMYVSPEHRGVGLGFQLLQTVLPYAWQSLGVAQVNLGVHTENASAIKLYRRIGFVVWGTEMGALVVGGESQDEHHMVCRAPSAASLKLGG
jgi:RimJ/RimL family protein N-acetyltransferase